ncbi:MAG: Hsp20/alpha crystallin family protein [Erysipelotrichaceae bacterium]|nr:Hsp20/alpha crystallin family protein [Erysipelotrichaceae bacterium]
MFMPELFTENLFDDSWMLDLSKDLNHVDQQLYGRKAGREMLTDVHEMNDHYEMEVNLPGFKKEEINIEVNEGYLTISAAKGVDKDQKDEKGHILHQERYAGSISRSFYIGEEVSPEEVHAKFEDGVLHLNIPKKEEKTPERNTIMIE